MIPQDINEITKEDIEKLISSKIQESISLEFKEMLNYESYEERKEFLADITAFANASGGDIVYGIVAKRDQNGNPTGEAERAVGIVLDNWDEVKNSLINIIRNSVQPNIPRVTWKKVDGFKKGPIVIARVLKSWISPHMVVSQKSRRFYTRTSAGKFLMDAQEIRSAFLRTAEREEDIKVFRDTQLASIISGKTPIPMPQGPMFACHFFPFSVIEERIQLDFSDFPSRQDPLHRERSDLFKPIGYSEYQFLRNFDGYLLYSPQSRGKIKSYTQLFRNGAIESVVNCEFKDKGEKLIDIVSYYQDIQKKINIYLQGIKNIGLNLPVVLMLSLINGKGYTYRTNHYIPKRTNGSLYEEQEKIDRDILILPDIIINDYEIDPVLKLKPLFDILWNAVGYDSAPEVNR
jgi:hypothetical protein